jgi:hypothetical protein
LIRSNYWLGTSRQHQHNCSAFAHQLKWFERGVQQEYSTHRKNYRLTDWRKDHFAASTIANGLALEPVLPFAVLRRKAQ